MGWGRNALLDTALAYAGIGVPVVPAFPLVRSDRSAWPRPLRRGRGSWICGCADPTCRRPGAHPLSRDAAPLATWADIRLAWESDPPPAVMIVPDDRFDVWEVPAVLGAAAIRQMEHERLRIWPPTSRLPDRRWLMVTAPVDDRTWHSEWPGFGVRRVDRSSTVLVPPSRTPRGVMHWMWSRRSRTRRCRRPASCSGRSSAPRTGWPERTSPMSGGHGRGTLANTERRTCFPPAAVGSWRMSTRDDPITGLLAWPGFFARLPNLVTEHLHAGRSVGLSIGKVDDLDDYIESACVPATPALGHLAGVELMSRMGATAREWLHDGVRHGCLATFSGAEIFLVAEAESEATFVGSVRRLRAALTDALPRSVSFAAAVIDARSVAVADAESRDFCVRVAARVERALLLQRHARRRRRPSLPIVTISIR
jgi:GGDEF domain-containing protein